MQGVSGKGMAVIPILPCTQYPYPRSVYMRTCSFLERLANSERHAVYGGLRGASGSEVVSHDAPLFLWK